jgi:hypothetical protein
LLEDKLRDSENRELCREVLKYIFTNYKCKYFSFIHIFWASPPTFKPLKHNQKLSHHITKIKATFLLCQISIF